MKTFKIIIVVFIALLTAVFLYLNYQTHFSAAAKKGNVNKENIKKVEAGMSVDEVLSIMGQPDIIDYCDGLDSISKGYNYNTNDESFVNVTVCFDSTMRVKGTYFPKQ
jgi:outer membrane protein assembly factor BamE (lipoprotein component of BamABCDE complex)